MGRPPSVEAARLNTRGRLQTELRRQGMMKLAERMYEWRWRKQHPERFGTRCRIVSSAATMTDLVTVEFEDGVQLVVPRVAVRRAAE